MGFLDMLRPKIGKRAQSEAAAPQPPPPSAASEPRITVPAANAVATAGSKTYTVKAGDTLSKIAKEQLGDPNKYPILFEANRSILTDPDKIYPGQVLKIPIGASTQLH